MAALTKAQLAEWLVSELGLARREAKEVVDLFFQELIRALANNEPVKLSGFGNFELRNKGERPGRNPKTGQGVSISARRVVTFHAGQKLRVRVAAYVRPESEG